MNLYLAVVLKHSREKIIVPETWCDELNLTFAFNNGGNRQSKMRKIFFSPDENKRANFNIDIKENFTTEEDACYYGY